MINRASFRRAATASTSALLAAVLLGACSGEKPETLLASGKEFMAKNDNKAAIIQIKNALQKDANLPEARFLLGKALLASGNPTAAEVELRKALDLKYPHDQVIPLLAHTLVEMGEAKKVTMELAKAQVNSADSKADLLTTVAVAHAALGNKEEAQKSLDQALAIKPDFTNAIIVQARLKALNNDLPGALALIDAALAKVPNDHDAWKLKADLLLAQQQTEPALAAYRKVLEIRPDSTQGHTAVITLLMQQSKQEEAEKQLEAMKKAAPKQPQTLYMEAMLAYHKKNFTAARDASQQLLKVAPNAPKALELAGEIEFKLKSFVQAEANLAKAVQLAPDLQGARRVLTQTYLRLNQAPKALSTLQPILDKAGANADMMALAGEVFLQNGDAAKAEEYFRKALALDPNNAAKRTAVALTHLARAKGQTADSVYAELEQIAASDTGTTADLALISALLAKNQNDKALKAIGNLEKKQPDLPLPHYLRGRTLLAMKDVASARKSFEQAIKLSPTHFPAAASLASLDIADKQLDTAKKRFESILAVEPKHVQALLALADIQRRTGASATEVTATIQKAVAAGPTDPMARIALINAHLTNKDPKKAASVAQEAAAVLPDNTSIADLLGRTLQLSGELNQALTAYNKLASLQPASPLPHLRIAEIQLANKNYDAVEQSLRKALELKPGLIEAQRGLVITYLLAKHPEKALVVAREVQKQRPKEAIGYLLEGDVAVLRKSWPDAIAIYRKGLDQAPATELAIKLYSSLYAANNTAEAEQISATWMKNHPKDSAFRLAIGDLAMARKDFASAFTQYKMLLELQPNNALILNNLAWVAAKQNDPNALEYAEKANQIAPNQPALMDTLAELVAAKGDTARALTLQQKAVELAPEAASLRLNLAKMLIKTGNKPAAKKELEALAKLGVKFSNQAEVTQLMKSL